MTTIWDSFDKALRQFQLSGVQIETNSKESGTLTAESTPPMCCIKIPIQHWTDLASRLCLDKHSHQLRAKCFPDIEETMRFISEADVVKASAQYLTHPVHLAWGLVCPDDTQASQFTMPGKNMISSSRPDLTYFSGEPRRQNPPGNSQNIYAVLEYKKFQGLKRDQFNSGIVTDYDAYASAWMSPRFSDPSSKTVMILKQATHYAWRFGTPFVALCDYKTLILLVMTKAEERHGGPYTYMTVVGDSSKMRKAYLGFLLAAKSYSENTDDWRMSRDGEDLFARAEEWEREHQSGTLGRNPKRDARNSDPVHVAPSSDESD